MDYSIESGFENCKVGAKIFDGTRIFNGLLKDASSEELKELYLNGIPHIKKSKATKTKKKKRDNSPKTPPPAIPPHE